jgi:D-sedoheptulose 7-phosphate isomerase
MMKANLEQSFRDAVSIASFYFGSTNVVDATIKLSEQIAATFQQGGKVLIAGNGGSACDAMHFAEEFTGRYRKNRRALPVISLTDPSHITCVGNDFGFEEIFARGVEAYGKPGDLFIGISTSGNSENVIRAVKKAKELKMTTTAFLGKDGGKLKSQCDVEFIVPAQTADRIQEIHMTILHIVIEGVERILFPELYKN